MTPAGAPSVRDLPGVGRPLLAAALAIAPVAWTVHLVAGVALVPHACDTGRTWPLHLVNVATLAAALVGVGAAVRLRRAGDAPAGSPSAERRVRFLTTLGLFLSILFVGFIVLESIPTLVLDPCR